jgi:RNA polymerase sigma-70 factor, ECF subfamily
VVDHNADRSTGDAFSRHEEVAQLDILAELLRDSARGIESSFAELYDLVSTRVYGLSLRVVRDRELAAEVTQEALLDVWRSASRFDPARGSALSWILTIVHRRAVDRVRSAEASVRREDLYARRNQMPAHDWTAEEVESKLEARRVRLALESLTPMQRDAVELSYFGGYTHTEIASMLGLPLGTAKARIRDGLIRLRDAMGVGGDR